jgi:hypothetical protein
VEASVTVAHHHTRRGLHAYIAGIIISETGSIFASTSSDGTVYVWELVLPSTAGSKQVKIVDYVIHINIKI